ncbi:MAG TPA: response regulator [Thioploca sp.]|nr:response regulator [Thioploca sp.]
MQTTISSYLDKNHILVVDDEPDIHKVTKMSLRGLEYRGRKTQFSFASSGKEAVEIMRSNPDIAVILLDVVMETNSAGLDACRAIREELGNHFVRILLRTGQPGSAPERQTIDEYDIDGYLPKTELTTNRLYSAVRTAIKAWEELVELERHRELLTALHEGAISMHSFEALETTLERLLETSVTISPSPLAVLQLETFEQEGNPRQLFLHLATDTDMAKSGAAAKEVATRIARDPALQSQQEAGPVEGGYLIPLRLHRELGYGWIYLEGVKPDEFATNALPLLAAHAANALYSTVAQAMLADRENPIYDTMII